MKIKPMIAQSDRGRIIAISMSGDIARHIHLDHVAAGFEISSVRYNESVEPWESILTEPYLASLRKDEGEGREIMGGLVMEHAKAAVEKPMMLRYHSVDRDAVDQDAKTQCVQLLTRTGLLVIAKVRRPEHSDAAESFEVCTAYYPKRVISVKPKERFAALARKILRTYAVAVTYPADDSKFTAKSPPDAAHRVLVHGQRNPEFWVSKIEFESLENWGFAMRNQRWAFQGTIPAWDNPPESPSTSIDPYPKTVKNASQEERGK